MHRVNVSTSTFCISLAISLAFACTGYARNNQRASNPSYSNETSPLSRRYAVILLDVDAGPADINDQGTVILNGNDRCYRWKNGVIEELHFTPNPLSEVLTPVSVHHLNNNGACVGFQEVIYRPGPPLDLQNDIRALEGVYWGSDSTQGVPLPSPSTLPTRIVSSWPAGIDDEGNIFGTAHDSFTYIVGDEYHQSVGSFAIKWATPYASSQRIRTTPPYCDFVSFVGSNGSFFSYVYRLPDDPSAPTPPFPYALNLVGRGDLLITANSRGDEIALSGQHLNFRASTGEITPLPSMSFAMHTRSMNARASDDGDPYSEVAAWNTLFRIGPGNHVSAEPFSDIVAWPEGTTLVAPAAINNRSMIAATVRQNGNDRPAILLPIEMTLHRRGTINAPGARINRPADAEAVYEVVTLENADWDEQEDWTPNSMASAADGNRQDGATEAVNLDRDDDFVKIKLHCPAPRMAGSIELVMDRAGQGDRMQADHLRFYDDQGNRIQLADLRIEDLQNPTGPLAPMLEEDGLELFVEIADLGMLTRAQGDANSNQLRYADLILRISLAGRATELKGRIYRGGYWLNQRNGNTGTIAFYDGKGRYQDHNGTWQIDVGNLVHGPFNIISGTRENGQWVTDETRRNRGPTPGGWYGLYERPDINPNWQFSQRTQRWSRPQQDHNYNHPSGGQQRPPLQDATGQYWQQGSYSQWSMAGNRTAYTHRGAPPPSVQFKFELVNWGHGAHDRDLLQIHPDGWNDGTAGCVGLQNYNDCCRIFFLLRHDFGTRLQIETP